MEAGRLVKVRAKTRAKNEAIRELTQGHLEISVREKPEQNAANNRILELAARHFGISSSRLRIIKGHHRPPKTLVVLNK